MVLLRLGISRPAAPPPEPFIELRLVETQGAGPAATPAPPAPPAPPPVPASPPPAPPPAPAAKPAPPPVPAEHAESLPPPPPPAPPPRPARQEAKPAPRPVPAAPSTAKAERPEVNLGGGDSLTNALASGRAVLPARVDAHWHNREPIYPAAAARRGEQGVVVLAIRVTPDGTVSAVEVAQSSGFILLDRAAREAVETWHFLPAVRDGQPVASSMPLRVLFQLN